MKKLVISEITNEIYYATVKDLGNGLMEVTGKQENVTDSAVKLVFEWFKHQYEEDKDEPITIWYKDSPYCLTFGKRFNFDYKSNKKDLGDKL